MCRWVLDPRVQLSDLDKVDTVTADDRGRVTLGTDFADETVKVYVERVDA